MVDLSSKTNLEGSNSTETNTTTTNQSANVTEKKSAGWGIRGYGGVGVVGSMVLLLVL